MMQIDVIFSTREAQRVVNTRTTDCDKADCCWCIVQAGNAIAIAIQTTVGIRNER